MQPPFPAPYPHLAPLLQLQRHVHAQQPIRSQLLACGALTARQLPHSLQHLLLSEGCMSLLLQSFRLRCLAHLPQLPVLCRADVTLPLHCHQVLVGLALVR